MKIRVVLADDHQIVLAGLRMLLEGQPDFELVGQATSGTEALRVIKDTRPDIAILDISLPQLSGIVITRQLQDECPDVRFILLTSHEDRGYLTQALEAGARGYVLKKSASECLIDAVRGVRVGGLYVDPSMAVYLPDASRSKVGRAGIGLPGLSEREIEVLKLVALGLTTKQIADRLQLSAKSVETYRGRGCAKLGIRTRDEIVRFAVAQGWLSGP